MRERKDRLLADVLALKQEDEELCHKLAEEPHYISTTVLPTAGQLEEIKKHIARIKASQLCSRGIDPWVRS